MILSEFNALPAAAVQPTEAERERLMQSARNYRQIEERAYSGFSGADRADAPRHGYKADALGAIAQGKDVEATIALFDAKWRAYCAQNNTKVDAAPKTARGPRAGQSCIEHRWTNPDAWSTDAIFIRQMASLKVEAAS